MTINELIAKAEKARNESLLGGDTCVCLSEPEIEYREFHDTFLEQEYDKLFGIPSAIFLLKLEENNDNA